MFKERLCAPIGRQPDGEVQWRNSYRISAQKTPSNGDGVSPPTSHEVYTFEALEKKKRDRNKGTKWKSFEEGETVWMKKTKTKGCIEAKIV